jgi:hypothetical protein
MMKMQRTFAKMGVMGLAALIFGCVLATTALALPPSPGGLIESGCVGMGYRLDCSSLGLEERFGCSQISNASAALNNLTPNLPIAECLTRVRDNEAEEGIVREGCMLPSYRRYIVLQDGEFRLIRTRAELLALFAPVETPEEAISFAVAFTNSFPKYDTTAPEGYFPVTSSLQPTYAKEVEQGFEVHLFDIPICGCSTHPCYAVDYLVTREGVVTELSRQKAYDSGSMICFD